MKRMIKKLRNRFLSPVLCELKHTQALQNELFALEISQIKSDLTKQNLQNEDMIHGISQIKSDLNKQAQKRDSLVSNISQLLKKEEIHDFKRNVKNDIFETPWAMPEHRDCYFYHSMDFPDGESVTGCWTIPDFGSYIGNYDIKGKTVLDIGTASGYLAFNAEKAGAEVTALDMKTKDEFCGIPFPKVHPCVAERKRIFFDDCTTPLKKSWWYSWHKYKSNARCVYQPHKMLNEWSHNYDIVIAGAIVEHLSDPVTAIGAWASVAREAIIIPFTDVIDDDDQIMRTLNQWDYPGYDHGWWQLSAGLYRRIFSNLGFDFSTTETTALQISTGKLFTRPTIIACRQTESK